MNLYLFDIKENSTSSISLIGMNKRLRGEYRRVTIHNIYRPYYIKNDKIPIQKLFELLQNTLKERKIKMFIVERRNFAIGLSSYIKIEPSENIDKEIARFRNSGDFQIHHEFANIVEQVIIERNLKTPSKIYIGDVHNYNSIKILEVEGIPDFRMAAILFHENKYYVSFTSYSTFLLTQIAEANYVCSNISELYFLLNMDGTMITISHNCSIRSKIDFDLKSYLLSHFSSEDKIKKYSIEEIMQFYNINRVEHPSENIIFLLKQLNIFRLFDEIAKICNVPISIIFMQNSLLRTEYLLNKEMYKSNIIMGNWAKEERRGYEGGLVLDPAVGIYRDSYIALIDFNSLYPSIIIDGNLCFTAHHVLPTILRILIEKRRSTSIDSERQAYKLVANSIYGCFGSFSFRYYDPSLASKITDRGRSLLMETRDFFIGQNYKVIYGDTDSLMIDLNICTGKNILKAKRTIENFLRIINKGKKIILALEKIFTVLILYGKKTYGGYYVKDGKNVLHHKGLDINRKDHPVFINSSLKFIFNRLLENDFEAIEKFYRHIDETIKNEHYSNLLSYKTIRKNISEYDGSTAHIEYARRIAKELNIIHGKNDTIEFLYGAANYGSDGSVGRRMIHISELENRRIDHRYYIEHVFMPSYHRLMVFSETKENKISLRESIDRFYFFQPVCQNKNCNSELLLSYCVKCNEYFKNIYGNLNEEFDIFLDLYNGDEHELQKEILEKSDYRMIDLDLYFNP